MESLLDEQLQIAYKHPLDAGGWAIVYHAITLDQRLSDGAFRLYLLLHRFAQQRQKAWPSIRTLAAQLGVSPRTIIRRLQELELVGLVERHRERFGGVCTTYLQDPHAIYARDTPISDKFVTCEAPISDKFVTCEAPISDKFVTCEAPISDKFVTCEAPISDKFVTCEAPISDKFVTSYVTNLSHHEEIIIEEEEEEEEEEEGNSKTNNHIDKITQTLTENGIFPEVAREIADAMSANNLTADDALAIWIGTLQSIQTGMPRGEEEIIGLAVERLRRGIWDAGEQGRAALRRARYGSSQQGVWAPGEKPEIPSESESEKEPRAPPDAGEALWEQALTELQLELTRATFETWLRNSRLVAHEDGVFVIGVANTYARDWLESRLRSVVARVLTRLTGRTASVRFVVEDADG